MTKADRLAAALDDLLAVSPDVEAAAVVSADGLPMASALPPSVEEDRLAAMSAALLTLGERAATGLGKGALGQVFVEGDHGHVVLMSAGENAVLVAVTTTLAKIGLVLFEMRAIAARIGEVMKGDDEAGVTEPAPIRTPEPTPSSEVEPLSPEWVSGPAVSPLPPTSPGPAGSEMPGLHSSAPIEESKPSWLDSPLDAPVQSLTPEPATEEQDPSLQEGYDSGSEVTSWQ